MIKAVIVNVGKEPEVTETGTNFKELEEWVGGIIQQVTLQSRGVAILLNDVGIHQGLKYNRDISKYVGKNHSSITGNFIVIGYDSFNDEYVDLPEEEIKRASVDLSL